MKKSGSALKSVIIGLAILGLFLAIKTGLDLKPVPDSLTRLISDINKFQAIDCHGNPLTVTYQNRWNSYNFLPLHDIPEFLQQSFIIAEDKRFYDHNGVDWKARCRAVWQNVKRLAAVRGASTISEQVVRLIRPRPRTLWSRWLEGFEARSLERNVTKNEILEFYLNQVPYASNRRGVLQAARYYFNRDLDTLSMKEMMALSVLVRAPSHLDLYKNPETIEPSIDRLALRLQSAGLLSQEDCRQIQDDRFQLEKPVLPVYAGHFINYIFSTAFEEFFHAEHVLRTTLDSNIQKFSQEILDQRLTDLKPRKVTNGAVLIVDHTSNEVLAWVNAGKGNPDVPCSQIDAVTALRQPGSSMKPFLYALALESGWTASHVLDDQALMEPVGQGLHAYHNYSRTFYGPVSLREALGNSLNIPAIHTIQFVGVDHYLSRLRSLGFESLFQHPDYYGDGLALGNGEVKLLELVQAYTALANRGTLRPLKMLANQYSSGGKKQVFSEEIASIISNILSDPGARHLEFGASSLLNFTVQTAVKTGTSSDYRDAWAIGYNYKYTAGVWMGNLDGKPMDDVSGAIGPTMVLRSIFAELNRFDETKPLYLSPHLVKKEICDPAIQLLDGDCLNRTEWFIAGTEPKAEKQETAEADIRLVRPADGIQLAMDPRIPDDREAFEFYLAGITKNEMVDWIVDNKSSGKIQGGRYLWPMQRGKHVVKATVWKEQTKVLETGTVQFIVK